MAPRSQKSMFFPLPLPAVCRGLGKRKREVAWRVRDVWWIGVSRMDGVCRCGRSSATGEAVAVGGFDDEAGRGHGREAFVERGGADAARGAQLGERPGLIAVC